MALIPRALAFATLGAALAFATSCSLFTPSLTDDGLEKVSGAGPGSLYVKPGHPVGSYDKILLARKFGIHYSAGQEPLEPRVEQALVDHMIHRIVALNREFDVVDTPDHCTTQMGLYLTRVQFYEPTGSGSQTSYVNSYGSATLVFEFRDAMTEEPLVRYGQTARLGSGVQGGTQGPDLDRLKRALDQMLFNVGVTLQERVPVADTTVESEHGCEGNIAKAVMAAREKRSRR
ncbi:MAG: hypothetical protein ACR2P8_09385 [Myxococcota bacterium]